MPTDASVSGKTVTLNDEERIFLVRLAQRSRSYWEKDLDWAASHAAIKKRDHAIGAIARIDNLIAKLGSEGA